MMMKGLLILVLGVLLISAVDAGSKKMQKLPIVYDGPAMLEEKNAMEQIPEDSGEEITPSQLGEEIEQNSGVESINEIPVDPTDDSAESVENMDRELLDMCTNCYEDIDSEEEQEEAPKFVDPKSFQEELEKRKDRKVFREKQKEKIRKWKRNVLWRKAIQSMKKIQKLHLEIENRIRDKNFEIRQENEKIRDTTRSIKDNNKEIVEQNALDVNLTRQITAEEKELNDYTKKTHEVEHLFRERQAEMESVQRKFNSIDDRLKTIQKSIAEKTVTAEQLQDEVQSLNNEIDVKTKRITELDSQTTKRQRELDSLRAEVAVRTTQLRESRNSLSQSLDRMAELRVTLTKAANDVEAKEEEQSQGIRLLGDKKTDVTNQGQENKKKIEETQMEEENIQRNLAVIERTGKDAQARNDQSRAIVAQIAAKVAVIKDLDAQIAARTAALKAQEEQIEKLKGKLRDLDSAMEAKNAEIDENVRKTQDSNEKFADEKRKYEEENGKKRFLNGEWYPWILNDNRFRTPMWSRYGKVCIISGILWYRGWPPNWLIGQMPDDCRPSQRLIFATSGHQFISRIDIAETGELINVVSDSAWNYRWLNLDNTVFPVKVGNAPALGPGVVRYDGYYQGPLTYTEEGFCSASGLIRRDSGPMIEGSLLLTLPDDCRPNKRMIFGCAYHGSIQRCDAHPDGRLIYLGFPNIYWISLTSVNFFLREGSALTLAVGVNPNVPESSMLNGGSNYRAATYKRTGDLCAISGVIVMKNAGGFSQSQSVATLPETCRPKKKVIFVLLRSIYSGDQRGGWSRFDISPSGEISHEGSHWGEFNWINLSGITFSMND